MEIRKVSESKTRRAVEFIARENTWSNQRRKRREESKRPSQQPHDQPPESKKMKVEDGSEAAAAMNNGAQTRHDFYLKCLLLVGETGDSAVSLQIQWIEGGLARESVNQVLQYLKNHLFDK